jgi:hypothetical protein
MLSSQLFDIQPKDKIAANEVSPNHFQMPVIHYYGITVQTETAGYRQQITISWSLSSGYDSETLSCPGIYDQKPFSICLQFMQP